MRANNQQASGTLWDWCLWERDKSSKMNCAKTLLELNLACWGHSKEASVDAIHCSTGEAWGHAGAGHLECSGKQVLAFPPIHAKSKGKMLKAKHRIMWSDLPFKKRFLGYREGKNWKRYLDDQNTGNVVRVLPASRPWKSLKVFFFILINILFLFNMVSLHRIHRLDSQSSSNSLYRQRWVNWCPRLHLLMAGSHSCAILPGLCPAGIPSQGFVNAR